MSLRGNILKAAIIGLTLAIYQFWGSSLWEGYIESTGSDLTVSISALGWTLAALISFIVAWVFTRGMDKK